MVGVRRQTRIYLDGVSGRRPPIPLDAERLEQAARRCMRPEAFDISYNGTGAGRELSLDVLLTEALGSDLLVHMSLDGDFLGVIAEVWLPAAVAIHGDYAAIGGLKGRVTILDKAGKLPASGAKEKADTVANSFLKITRALDAPE